jgi:UDP-N-acetylglucosamine--N-acetylmuramyl-(pentapeptide) pyrophosphoryl-undecaprenol N-acetylglucosamine transferase
LEKKEPYRLIISGGGTGGHIFPAIAIANAFKERHPDAQVLFVGARGRMEMTRVPEAGYKIIGLWISGLQRSLSLTNVLFPVKVIVSYLWAAVIIRRFKPHVVIGTGGYASGPIMMAATRAGVPSLIQEQNSFAGLANKRVAKKVSKVCVAYEGMERYFPAHKIVLTGNPVRQMILGVADKKQKALNYFGFNAHTKTLLVMGGSLGARTINESIFKGIDQLLDANVQVIWQTGKGYYEDYKSRLARHDLRKVRLVDFMSETDVAYAYAAADVVISRAGAIAVSELCVAGKATILVPSPNVAEDHQTKNAKALTEKSAAILVKDEEARGSLVRETLRLLFDEKLTEKLCANILSMAKPEATNDIVKEIEKLINPNGHPSVANRQPLVMVMN